MNEFASFGECVDFHMRLAGLTMRELAEKANVTKTTISNIINNVSQSKNPGQPNIRIATCDAICDALGIERELGRRLTFGLPSEETLREPTEASKPSSSTRVHEAERMRQAQLRKLADAYNRSAADNRATGCGLLKLAEKQEMLAQSLKQIVDTLNEEENVDVHSE